MSGRKKLRDGLLLALTFALMMAALAMVFLYAPTEKATGIVQRIFYLHVPVAWVALLAFFITFVGSILYLSKREARWDALAAASAEVGVLFTTLVLLTGPIWARPVWGIWWTWDARLTTSLVLWLIYIAYLLVRRFAGEPGRGARLAAVVGIAGFIDVPLVFITVHLWRTQHPTTLVFQGGLTTAMLVTLLVCLAAFTLLYCLLVRQATRLRALESDIRLLRSMREE